MGGQVPGLPGLGGMLKFQTDQFIKMLFIITML